jgi:hypothetical protein
MIIRKVKQRNINLLDCHAEKSQSMNCNEISLDSARDDINYILSLMIPNTQYIYNGINNEF